MSRAKIDLDKDYAKRLFVEGSTNKVIAQRLGRTEKTIGKWANEGNWKKLRQSILTTKDTQLTRLYNQLDFITESIEQRENKVADTKEADIITKITASIRSLETETSIGEIVDVAKQIIQFTQNIDLDFAKQLTEYFDLFIKQKMK